MPKNQWDHGGKKTAQRGYGKEHKRIREELKRTVIFCQKCPPVPLVLGCVADHIIPLAKGGTGDRSNYQWLCQPCADKKDAEDRGVTYKPKRQIGPDGWPIEETK